MRWVLLCANPIESRCLKGLGHALVRKGHEVAVGTPTQRTSLSDFDVVMEVNRSRPSGLPQATRHIAWVQDYLKDSAPYYEGEDGCPRFDADARDGDLIYTFGDPYAMGIEENWRHWAGSLVDAADPSLLDRPPRARDLDFSICGYIPTPYDEFGVPDELTKAMVKRVANEAEKLFSPLSGTMHAPKFLATVKERFADDPMWEANKIVFGRIAREYARLRDRETAAHLVLAMSKNVEFRGSNWDRHPAFRACCKENTSDFDLIFDLYQRTRINVHTNVFGFGMHSRVLEAMAVGGFVMANKSRWVGKAGMMTEPGAFEPDVHFGEYDVDTFCGRAHYWLENESARTIASAAARKVVRGSHTWDHRAAQILRDLNQ